MAKHIIVVPLNNKNKPMKVTHFEACFWKQLDTLIWENAVKDDTQEYSFVEEGSILFDMLETESY